MFKLQSLAELKADILRKINDEKLGAYPVHTEQLLGTSDLAEVRYPQCDVLLNKFFEDLKSEGYRISVPQRDEIGATYIIYGKPMQMIKGGFTLPNSKITLTVRTNIYLFNTLTTFILTDEEGISQEFSSFNDALKHIKS